MVMTQSDIINKNFKQLQEENKVNNALITGDISTEKKMFEQVKEMKHSTFDRSKFTVVGSPTITDEGIASGFSSDSFAIRKANTNNYLSKPFEIVYRQLCSDNISNASIGIDINYATFANYNSTNNKMTCALVDNTNTTIVGYQVVTVPKVLTTNDYLIKLKWDGTTYYWQMSEDFGANWITVTTALCSNPPKAGNYDFVQIRGNAGNEYKVDLKYFYCISDGVEVFNGNKTGIDQIKKDDFTVVGSPVISDDGIASGFSASSSYLPTNGFHTGSIDLDVANNDINMQMILSPNTNITATDRLFGAGYNNDQMFLSVSTSKQLILAIKNPLIGTTTTVGVLLNDISFTDGNKVLMEILLTNSSMGLRIKNLSTNMSTQAYSPISDVNIASLDFYFGGMWGMPYSGSIDLNSLKIYKGYQLVYQPTLRIPYTLSKTGSKIVDGKYRERVQDVYNQFGSAPYYTLSDVDFTLPMGEIYGLIEQKASTTYVDNELEQKSYKSDVDGQWVGISALLITTERNVGTYNYDLSSNLPNDNYNYEVLLSSKPYRNSDGDSVITIGSSIIPKFNIGQVNPNNRQAYNTFILPIGTDRTVNYSIEQRGLQDNYLYLVAYRRLGKNA